jgi:hypothetical protein
MYFHGRLSPATQVRPCGYAYRATADPVSLQDLFGGGAMGETCRFRRTFQTSGLPCPEMREKATAALLRGVRED